MGSPSSVSWSPRNQDKHLKVPTVLFWVLSVGGVVCPRGGGCSMVQHGGWRCTTGAVARVNLTDACAN